MNGGSEPYKTYHFLKPVYNGPSKDDLLSICLCTLVHYSCALFSHISLLHHVAPFFVLLHVALASCRTFFVLHSFYVGLYPCSTISYCTLYKLQFFHVVPCSCCTFLRAALYSCWIFSVVVPCYTHFMLHFFVLHSFRVALFPCCTFFILHSFQVSLFLCCALFV